MKLLFSVLLLVAFAQEFTVGVEGSVIVGIIDRLLGGLRNMLNSIIEDVGGLISGLGITVTNLLNSVLGTVFNLVDNLLSLVDGLLAEASDSGKTALDDCVDRVGDLELVKQVTSEATAKCKSESDAEVSRISAQVRSEQDHGNNVITTATQASQNCLKGSLVASCLSRTQQSALQAIQGVVSNVQSLAQRISFASDEAGKCLNDAEDEGRRSANQIYEEIRKCITDAS